MRARPLRSRPAPRGALALAALSLIALSLATAGAARADEAGSVTATGGPVRATLSWQAAELGVANPQLVLERDGVQAFAASPFRAGSACAGGGCSLAASGKRDSPLQVRDLDADGEPEVLVDAFTGGAHCCATTEVFRRDAAGAYAAVGLRWGNAGYDVRDLDRDGRPELVTADDASPPPSPPTQRPTCRSGSCASTPPGAPGWSRSPGASPRSCAPTSRACGA